MWGNSPAIDIQSHIDDIKEISELHALNILLAGIGDIRHVLRTIAQSYRHTAARRINFYILEQNIETIARELLLLSLTLEPSEVMNSYQKSRVFLEIYSNSLIRPISLEYIRHKSNQLIHMVTDPSYLKSRIPILSLDQLKYKERDYLECTYKFWRTATIQEFDLINLWDKRLRNYLGVRYDARLGLFDWDYHMKLNASVEHGTPVTTQEYVNWRDTGIAYIWNDSIDCTDINVTFAFGSFSQQTFRMCEYLGDNLTGPFVNYGIDCEDQDMLKKYNNKYIKTSTEISERNVNRLMYEIAFRKPYEINVTEENGGGACIMENSTYKSNNENGSSTSDNYFSSKAEYSNLSVEDTSITFLSTGTLDDERPNARFRGLFNIILVGQKLLPQSLAQSLIGLAADDALILLEGRKFVVGPKRCEQQEFNEIVLEKANDFRLVPIPADAEYDPAHQDLMRYIFKRK